jgi:catechol 2,3-dioxygenase
MGHMHLHVGDVGRALAFYRDLLGLELMTEFRPSAAFLSAGGYHHRLGVNTWRGQGVPPAPGDAVGLRQWTIVLPEAADVDAVRERVEAAGVDSEDSDAGFLARDPWNNAVVLRAAG